MHNICVVYIYICKFVEFKELMWKNKKETEKNVSVKKYQ